MTRYSKPELRNRLKEELQASDKGGRPGQWSARKAQLLAQEYKRKGGGYTEKKDERSKHLDAWTKQRWQTRTGSGRADAGNAMKRYLPSQAWKLLNEDQKKETDRKKQNSHEQYVPNTLPARAARAWIDHSDPTLLQTSQLQKLTKIELTRLARDYDLRGRSRMNKRAIAEVLHEGFSEANTGMKKDALQKRAQAYGVNQSQSKESLIHDIVHAVSVNAKH